MDSEVRKYCKHIIKTHIATLRKGKNTKVRFWDYPAATVICYYTTARTRQYRAFSHDSKGTKWHSVLLHKMKRLGCIGMATNVSKNKLGNCAEQHAGNGLMNKQGINNLNTLYFTETVRPRTMQIIPYCQNCKQIFPNIK